MREGSFRTPDLDPRLAALNTQEIASKLLELAQRLEEQSDFPTADVVPAPHLAPGSIDKLVILAEEELRRRRLRIRHFPKCYFSEGAWAILLDLFVCQHRGRKVSTISACLASEVPETTALRWLEVLEKDGFIRREAAGSDRRVKYVTLTECGHEAVHAVIQSYL